MNCACIIPIYPPHYMYAKHIIDTIDVDIDLYFVFTTKADKELFPYNTKNIILEDHVDILKFENKNIFPSFKKLLGLSLLYEKYDYILCLDDEIQIINKIKETMIECYEHKVMIGGLLKKYMVGEGRILNTTLFQHTDRSYHKKLSEKGMLYTWWSVMPVYKSTNVKSFLDFISFNTTTFIDKCDWYFFEHMAYQYYGCLTDIKIIIIPEINHSFEFADSKYIKPYIKYIGWINKFAFNQQQKTYINQCIIYHLDRDIKPPIITICANNLYKSNKF